MDRHHSDADPDPTYHFDADPDTSFQIKAETFEKVLKKAHIPNNLACHLQIDAHSDPDPDQAYHFNADLDADPGPDLYLMRIRSGFPI